jgi:hypothetical protein
MKKNNEKPEFSNYSAGGMIKMGVRLGNLKVWPGIITSNSPLLYMHLFFSHIP